MTSINDKDELSPAKAMYLIIWALKMSQAIIMVWDNNNQVWFIALED